LALEDFLYLWLVRVKYWSTSIKGFFLLFTAARFIKMAMVMGTTTPIRHSTTDLQNPGENIEECPFEIL
jgi:hypothetical protein